MEAGGAVAPAGHHGVRAYPGRLTMHMSFTCIVAAMGGLIFGYDIGITAGVTSMDPFLKFFRSAKERANGSSTIKYCQLDSQVLALFTSLLYIAALSASLFASTPTRLLGRRNSMMLGGVLFMAGAIGSGLAQDSWMLIIGRLLLGLGVGFANHSVPLYLSEMAFHKLRGAFNASFQLFITFGVLWANVLNLFTAKISGDWGWRLSLGGAVLPALIITLGALVLPDTPSSMIERGQLADARVLLQRIRGVCFEEVEEEEFNDLVSAALFASSEANQDEWSILLEKRYRPQLCLAIIIPFFQQFTGINAIIFYAPLLFRSLGFGDHASIICAVITGVVNVVPTLVSVYSVDKWGRRALFLAGGALMLLCQAVIAASLGAELWDWLPNCPLGWLLPSEIFPLEIRSAAQSVSVSVNMAFTFAVAQIFSAMLCHLEFGVFVFFGFFVVVMSVFIYFFLPETKEIPLEEMSQIWTNHWYWSRFVTVAVADEVEE
ncbi:Sugar/inositol transporter [Trema orientale]|uniref:Sugar/inositol transporter n=1 Tax=Trema orientale TaxID=63057 RepID=A0A2P5FPN1_TREOI|nr:Sugar/inositol transporter [Trema orientale]